MSILLFILILAVLIIAHELGHFIAAKRAGVRVDEFGIGFPPRLWSKKVGETVYSVNAFPVGGFVKIFGENPDDLPAATSLTASGAAQAGTAQAGESLKGKDASRSLTHKPKLAQAWVISAGVVFNLLLAWVLLSAGFMAGMPYSVDDSVYGARVEDPALTITQVLPKSPAETAGLKGGDIIVALSSGKDSLNNPKVETTQKFIAAHDEVTLAYRRGGEEKTTLVRPHDGLVDGRRAIGISMDIVGVLKLSPYEAFTLGVTTTLSLTQATIVGLFDFFKNMFTGQADLSGVAGPVGLVGVVSDAGALGFMHLISLTALISINLAVINLLPFPALDGGRLFFLLIEWIKRSPIKPGVANAANGIGFLLLIALMTFVTFHDVVRIIYG